MTGRTTPPQKADALQVLEWAKLMSQLPGAVMDEQKIGLLKAAAYSRDGKLLKKVEELIVLESVEQVIDPDPFFPYTNPEQEGGRIKKTGGNDQTSTLQSSPVSEKEEIFIGQIIHKDRYGEKLFIPLESFERHTAIFGQSGSGKSFLIKHIVPQLRKLGITVIIFDCEGEYSSLLKSCPPEVVWILAPENDRDNILEPPPGVSPKEWLSKLKDIFREVFYLRDGAINLLGEVLTKLYIQRGVLAGSKDYPTIIDLIKYLDSLTFRPSSRFSGYHESLTNRFHGLFENLGETLSCKKGYDLTEEKKGKIIIYRTASLSDDIKNFYINLKILREASYREKLPPDGLKVAFVIEEAHTLYNRSIAERYDLGEPMVYRNSRKLRKRGICNIYSDQVPSELPAPLSANINNHFILKTINGRCIRRVAHSINLLPEQAKYLPIMEQRQCIVQSGNFPDPILIEIPELCFDYVTEEEIQTHMKPILSILKFTPIEESVSLNTDLGMGMTNSTNKKPNEKPNNIWKKILKTVHEKAPVSLKEIYQNCDVNHFQGRKILETMEKQDMIESRSVCFGSRGNPKTYVVLKPNGAAFIGIDFEKVRLIGKGSTEHIILQHLIAQAMKDTGKNVLIEHYINGKSVDIAEIGEKKSIAYEIELSPSHPHVIDNIRKDFDAGFSKIVVITQNKAGMEEARKQVILEIDFEKLSKVEFKLPKDFLLVRK